MGYQFPFKIAVFDLDRTLWNGTRLYEDSLKILKALTEAGVITYIASFHQKAEQACNNLEISKYLTGIEYGRTRNKAQMISDILSKHSGIDQTDVCFFDDQIKNIALVKTQMGIKGVHVRGGIKWRDLITFPTFTLPSSSLGFQHTSCAMVKA